jgi:serine/threonine protein kinase
VILYEMIAGTAPFQGDSAVETLHAILKHDPPRLASRDEIPAELEHLIRHCLEKDPAERFQSARDLAFVLEIAFRAAQRVPDVRPPQSQPRSRGLLAALLGLL